MRISNKSKLLTFLMALSLCACEPVKYSFGGLRIRNDTEQDLYVESHIRSRYSNNGDAFVLSCDSLFNIRRIALTKNFDESYCDYSIEQIVWNEDAFVRIYSIEETDTILLKEWKYSERDSSGKQLFNLSDSSMETDISYSMYDDIIHVYIFPITQEDLVR